MPRNAVKQVANNLAVQMEDAELEWLLGQFQIHFVEIQNLAKNFREISQRMKTNIDEINRNLQTQAQYYKTIQGTKKGAIKPETVTSDMQDIYQKYLEKQMETKASLASNIPKDYYSAYFKFQTDLLKILGITMETIFVVGGETVDVLNINAEQAISFEQGSGGKLTGRFAKTQIDINTLYEQARKAGSPLDNLMNQFKEFKPTLDQVYNTVLFRYNRSGDRRIVLWWYPNTDYDNPSAMKVSSAGDLAEAYMDVLLNTRKTLNMSASRDLEYNINEFMLGYVSDVDNVSGFFVGDINNGLRSTQYAIKSAGASTLGLKQIDTLVSAIIQATDGADAKLVNQIKKMTRGRKRNIAVQKEAIEALEDLIQQIQAKM